MKFPSNACVPLLGFAAYSGAGKTTLLKQLIPILIAEGIRVGLIKHAHHDFEVDYPGKDSYELRKVGATPVMLSSSRRRAVFTEHPAGVEASLNQELKFFDQTHVDLILVEGFKQETFPKIEIYRRALGKPWLYPEDPMIIAIATEEDPELRLPIQRLDINSPAQVAEFILTRFLVDAKAYPFM